MTNLIYMLRSKAPTYYCDKENDKARFYERPLQFTDYGL